MGYILQQDIRQRNDRKIVFLRVLSFRTMKIATEHKWGGSYAQLN